MISQTEIMCSMSLCAIYILQKNKFKEDSPLIIQIQRLKCYHCQENNLATPPASCIVHVHTLPH